MSSSARSLAFLDLVAVVDVELLHDAAGLGLDLDLGDGLDLAGGDHALRQVAFFDLGQLRGVDLGAAAGEGEHDHRSQQDDSNTNAAIDE